MPQHAIMHVPPLAEERDQPPGTKASTLHTHKHTQGKEGLFFDFEVAKTRRLGTWARASRRASEPPRATIERVGQGAGASPVSRPPFWGRETACQLAKAAGNVGPTAPHCTSIFPQYKCECAIEGLSKQTGKGKRKRGTLVLLLLLI